MTRGTNWSQQDDAVAQMHDEIVAAGLLEPLALGTDDETAWLDCELASFAENRLGFRFGAR